MGVIDGKVHGEGRWGFGMGSHWMKRIKPVEEVTEHSIRGHCALEESLRCERFGVTKCLNA